MKVYVVLMFNRENYPSTTEYVSVFATREKAEKYIKKTKGDYSKLQEIYIEEKTI